MASVVVAITVLAVFGIKKQIAKKRAADQVALDFKDYDLSNPDGTTFRERSRVSKASKLATVLHLKAANGRKARREDCDRELGDSDADTLR